MLHREGRKRRSGGGPGDLAVVQVPTVLSRFVPLPASEGRSAYLFLEDLIGMFLGELFPGFTVEHRAAFRVTRNWDLNVDEEESEDLLSTIQEELRRRDRGMAVRLELDQGATLAHLPNLHMLARQMRDGSDFLRELDASDQQARYAIYPYTRLNDGWVGESRAAPKGRVAWWVSAKPFEDSHLAAARDVRILADIGRRLRDEPPFTQDPPAPLPQ